MSIVRANNEEMFMVLTPDDESYALIPQNPNGLGLYYLPSEIDVIINRLQSYVNLYSDEDIVTVNDRIRDGFFISQIDENTKIIRHNKLNEGYVYVLECAGTYKVGFSTNVERRISQLDTRPFKINLVAKIYSKRAYAIEQLVHKKLSKYRAVNEWYHNVTEQTILDTIYKIMGDMY